MRNEFCITISKDEGRKFIWANRQSLLLNRIFTRKKYYCVLGEVIYHSRDIIYHELFKPGETVFSQRY